MSESGDKESIESTANLQQDRLESLTKIYTNFKKDTAARKTKQYFVQRLMRIDEIRAEFLNDHKVLVCSDTKRANIYFKNDIHSTFDELYLDVSCAFKQRQAEMYPPEQSTTEQPVQQTSLSTNRGTSSVKFPHLPVPSFSGKFTEWTSFYDAFKSLVHTNHDLNAIQKFQYLKKALSPDRDLDIQQMLLTDSNYETAWEMLLKRYNNSRILFMHHMNALYSLPVLLKERSDDIKGLLNTANVCVNEFKRLQIPIDQCNQWMAHYLSTKLPTETHQAWERHLGSNPAIPTFADLESFLNLRLFTIDAIENRTIAHNTSISFKSASDATRSNGSSATSKSFKRSPTNLGRNEKKSFHITTQPSFPREVCALCGEAHIIRRCPIFLSKDCYERKSIVDKSKLCLNCLSKSHALSQCTSTRNCLQCGQRHNTLLHFPKPSQTAIAQPSTTSFTTPLSANRGQMTSANNGPSTSTGAQAQSHSLNAHAMLFSNTAHMGNIHNNILLATALVELTNDDTGQSALLHALIDQGSEGTLISEHAVQRLGLQRRPTSAEICGVGGNAVNETRFAVSCILRSCTDPTFSTPIDTAYVLKSLTTRLPSHPVEPQNWSHLNGLTLADPDYYQPKRIDLIVGADMFANIILPQIRFGAQGQPLAQNTRLGWILSGHTGAVHTNSVTVRCHHSTVELEALVQKFYELEQVPIVRAISVEDQWCEDFFQKTHIRQSNGKYLVRLPLKCLYDPSLTLGKSRQIALNRFYQLERRLQRNVKLQEQYRDGIEDYFRLKQIVPAETTEEEHSVYTTSKRPTVTSCVLPHHAVFKNDSLTTKVRIVYDASSKTSNGRSLNDLLCVGTPLQNDLTSVLLNWRTHKYIFTADIQKMYRCIDMHLDDAHYQRILWRNEFGNIQEYCLTTVTFGTASAPYTAIRVMHQLANDEQHRYPRAASILRNDMYVDDVQTGSHCLEDALEMRDQLIQVLRTAGMELRKWSSNEPALLSSIPVEHQSDSTILQLNSQDTIKTLGMYWQPNIDMFKYKINFKIDPLPTKRSVLSTIARLFDPLGLITPVVVAFKILLKLVWTTKIVRADKTASFLSWDEALPEPLDIRWQQLVVDLSKLEKISIPRWLDYDPTHIQSVELHVFCDGSSSAYAANIYIRIEYNNNQIHTHLLTAKSKVTPNTPLTIPRVELCGAVLGTTLTNWIKKELRIVNNDTPTFYWTDASIVLHWIHGDLNRWKLFVANRVGKIQSSTSLEQWSHVKTTENPADCAKRGMSPEQLAKHDLWWAGPSWLRQPKLSWPKFNLDALQIDESLTETKVPQIKVHIVSQNASILSKYSSLSRLLRILALILRFCHNSSPANHKNRRVGPISAPEWQRSLLLAVRLTQNESYTNDIHLIQSNEPLSNKSSLSSLTPFLDEANILRVRGRIQRSNLPYRQKHPIILPSSHHFTTLVIDDAHLNTLHGGIQLTLAQLRQRFWILKDRRTVRNHLRKCVKCFKTKPKAATQLMGDLPGHRINPPHRPFLATGVDYTGAIELKSAKYRGNTYSKGYIAIFICLATKAVHLEAVTGMSTECFLWALQRFIGRRGICHDIYSDCGTNFIGAETVLQTNLNSYIKDIERDIVPKLTAQNIQWHFNPPHSPNFGGLWEANVKSVKYHLKRTISSNRLTYEELSTVLVRIEACLNSRPLCPLTSDPDDLFVLTPGHFLIGDSLLSPPETAAQNKNITHKYLELQRMVHQFWSKWSSDWLSHLQARPKWRRQEPNIQLNELVIVKDDRLPPNEWLLGRVIELHPGADHLVRVATIRTKNGLYKRSVSKICRLPIPTYTDESSPAHSN